ncbi:unnamed protein product [Prunus armeniaca]
MVQFIKPQNRGKKATRLRHCFPKERLTLSSLSLSAVLWECARGVDSNLRMIACSRCKGVGLIKEGGLFGLNQIHDLYESVGGGDSKGKEVYEPTLDSRQ